MAKLIFGCALMLGGIIGGTGWLIAVACLTEASAWSSLFNLFPVLGFGLLDRYVVLLFYTLPVIERWNGHCSRYKKSNAFSIFSISQCTDII